MIKFAELFPDIKIVSTLSTQLSWSHFIESQKHMTMDDEDFTLDLLFFHRILKRLVAVELKIGKFILQYKG